MAGKYSNLNNNFKLRLFQDDDYEGMLSINLRVGFKFTPAWLVYDKIIKGEE